MRKNKFGEDERVLLETFGKAEWHSIPSLEDEIAAYKAFAETQMEKTRQVNINLSKEDWEGIQRKAREAGVPSETLISKNRPPICKGSAS